MSLRKKSIWSILIVLSFIVTFSWITKYNLTIDNVKTSSASISLSTQADWEAGDAVNADLVTSPGSIKKDDKSSGPLDLKAIYNEDNTRMTTTHSNYLSTILGDSTGSAGCPVNTNCSWPYIPSPPGNVSLILDLGSIYVLNGVATANDCSGIYWAPDLPVGFHSCPFANPPGAYQNFYTSLNGVDYDLQRSMGVGAHVAADYSAFTSVNARYIKLESNSYGYDDINGYYYGLTSFSVRQPSKITKHISSAIDGGENFWEWEDFTDSKTVPANTSVTYRYRSSADGASWNSWHSDFGDVESRSGDTKYRYLQVEATLSNTDGVSTPTIDSYTIDYHTEVKPGTPSAQTAVVD